MESKSSRLRLAGSIILKLVAATLLMFILTGILSIPGIVYMMMTSDIPLDELTDHLFEEPVPGMLVAAAQFFGVLLTVYIMKRWKKETLKNVGWYDFWKNKRELVFGLLLGFVSITVIFFILVALGQITFETNHLLQPRFSWAFLIGLITFIFVALNEELFFRGYVISVLEPTHSKITIYIVSAVIFSCAHIFNSNVHFLGLVNIILIGLLFAYMYIETNRLWMPIGYHLTWNFFQGNVFGFQVSGNKTNSLYQPEIQDTILTGGAFGPEAGVLSTIVIVIGFMITRWFIQSKRHS